MTLSIKINKENGILTTDIAFGFTFTQFVTFGLYQHFLIGELMNVDSHIVDTTCNTTSLWLEFCFNRYFTACTGNLNLISRAGNLSITVMTHHCCAITLDCKFNVIFGHIP